MTGGREVFAFEVPKITRADCSSALFPSVVPPSRRQAVNELPQPQPPVAFGLVKVNPEPCIDVT